MFLDSVVTQVSAAHLADLKPGTSPADKAGILRELQALLQQVRCSCFVESAKYRKHHRVSRQFARVLRCCALDIITPGDSGLQVVPTHHSCLAQNGVMLQTCGGLYLQGSIMSALRIATQKVI